MSSKKKLREEQIKYDRMWKHPDYGNVQPGELYADLFVKMADLKDGDSIVDLGCGGGKGSEKLLGVTGKVTRVDITDTSLPKQHPLIPFIHQSIWEPFFETNNSLGAKVPMHWKYGYCTDVMEHIPTEYVMLTLQNIANHCDYVFFDICPMHENFGKHIGEDLHLTIRPFNWWKDRLNEIYAEVIEARDFVKSNIYYVKS